MGNLVEGSKMFIPFLKGVKITTRLIIKKNGKVVVDKPLDVVARWFERLFNSVLGCWYYVSSFYGTNPITAEDGVGYDFKTGTVADPFNEALTSVTAIKIAIGSGTPTPSLDSYALAVKEYEATSPSRSSYEYTTGRWETILAYTFAIDKTVTIQEAGIFYKCTDKTGATRWVLLSLDTFTAQSLVAGDSLTVEYRTRVEA